MEASRDGTCKGPVVDKTLVRVNPERRKLHVSGGRGSMG